MGAWVLHTSPAPVYTHTGLASTALVLSIAVPAGGNWWYLMCLISPAAGAYYLKNAERQEEVRGWGGWGTVGRMGEGGEVERMGWEGERVGRVGWEGCVVGACRHVGVEMCAHVFSVVHVHLYMIDPSIVWFFLSYTLLVP